MAIYWVDIYVQSPNGGIHGTTGVGAGTYAQPWILNDLVNSTKMATLSPGDEVRFKGLPEDTFFNVQSNWSSISGSGATTNAYNHNQNNKLLRLKALNGEIYYIAANTTSVRTIYGTSTWYSANPLQFPNYGYYICNPNYYLTSGPGGGALFAGVSSQITVTSGWTSETVRDGVTVFFPLTTSVLGSTVYFGPQGNTSYRNLDIDCPELILSANSSSMNLTVSANSIKLKHLGIAEYYPAGYLRAYSGSSSYTARETTGTFQVGSIATGSWCYFYLYGGLSNTPVSINVSTVGYQPSMYIYNGSGVVNRTWNLTIKNIYALSSYYLYADPGMAWTWNAPEGWSVEMRQAAGTLFGFSRAAITENFSTPQQQMFSGTFYNQFGYVVSPSTNNSPTTIQDTTFFSTAGSYLKRAVFGTLYKSWGRRLLIETPGQNIDTMTTPIASYNSASPYGSPYKHHLMYEESSKARVELMSPTSTGVAAAVFNSPSNSGKLTWRIFGEGFGKVYADSFALPMPSYGAGGLLFEAGFTTSLGAGLVITAKLYGMNTSTGLVASLGNATTLVQGQSVYCSLLLSQATLVNQSIGNLFVIIDVQKTNTDASSLHFNQMTVTAQ